MKQSKVQNVWAAVYFVLAALMYYFVQAGFRAGVYVMYKHLFAVIITFLSGCVFLVVTNLPRAGKLIRCMMILILPYLLNIAISIPLWVTDFRPWEEIRGGLFSQLYQINIILTMAGMVYVLGRKSIWVNLAAMLSANAVTFFETVLENGFGAYFRELWTVIVTFAEDTGDIIKRMEIHELTFALGVYLVFFLVNWKSLWKKPPAYAAFLLTAFFFLSGFKRIGIFAILFAFAVGLVLWIGTGRKKKHIRWLICAGIVATVLLVLYVYLVDRGFMTYLEERWGINLMGRANLLALVERFYHFGPDFMGQGTGFLQEYLIGLRGVGLHNDIVTLYVDIGFWGLVLWGIAVFPLRSWFLFREQGIHGAVFGFCYCIYLIGTGLTDNTFSYIYVTAAVAILTMAYRIEDPPDESPAPYGASRAERSIEG